MKPFTRARASLPGFTLIELLVMVTVVAVLAAIAFPVASRMLSNSRSAVCQSNLRGIGVAMQLYATDNNQVAVYDVLGENGSHGTWEDALIRYIQPDAKLIVGQRPPDVFACPLSHKLVTASSKSDYTKNFWLNPSETSSKLKYRLQQITPAASVLAFADGTGRYFNEAMPTIAFRHDGFANLLFFDGHVETAKSDQVKLVWGVPPLFPQ